LTEATGIFVCDDRRCANATVRGYLYQVCPGVARWLELEPGQVLLFEGDEDLDLLAVSDARRICEQVPLARPASDHRGMSLASVAETV
jgi:hypothetical protein